MKKMFLAFMAVATIAMVGCKNDPKEPAPTPTPTPTSDVPYIAPTAGAYTIVVNFEGPICEGAKIAFPNSTLTDDGGGWITALDQVAYMEAITKDDSAKDFTGKKWYKVVLQSEGETLQGKPVQVLDGEQFDWNNQTGDEASWTVLSAAEDVEIVAGYSGESDLTYKGTGKVFVLKSAYWKNKINPCEVTVYATVKFTVIAPVAVSDTETVYLKGGFDNWGAGVEMTPSADRKTWTASYDQVKDGTEYQYILNNDWNRKAIYTDADFECSGANFKVNGESMENAIDEFNSACPAPESDEVWIKCAGNGWTAARMIAADGADGTFTYETTIADAGNCGANIGVDEAMTGAAWYPLDMPADCVAGDAVVYTFVQTDGVTGELTLRKK